MWFFDTFFSKSWRFPLGSPEWPPGRPPRPPKFLTAQTHFFDPQRSKNDEVRSLTPAWLQNGEKTVNMPFFLVDFVKFDEKNGLWSKNCLFLPFFPKSRKSSRKWPSEEAGKTTKRSRKRLREILMVFFVKFDEKSRPLEQKLPIFAVFPQKSKI